MIEDISKIVSEEASIKAPIIRNLINEDVTFELSKMCNQIVSLSSKYENFNEKLTSFKTNDEQNSSPLKDRATSKLLEKMAQKKRIQETETETGTRTRIKIVIVNIQTNLGTISPLLQTNLLRPNLFHPTLVLPKINLSQTTTRPP